MSTLPAIRRYDDFIMGKAPFYLQAFLGKDEDYPEEGLSDQELREKRAKKKKLTEQEKEKDALAIVRYIVQDILGWTPQEAMDHIDEETAKKTHMDMLFKYVHAPQEIQRSMDYQWLIHRAFPSETKYDNTIQLFKLYHKVESGQMKKFPRHFFTGEDGLQKIGLLFRDYVSRSIPAGSVAELYELFSDNARAWNILRDAHLYYEVTDTGGYTVPLDFLHDTLGLEADDFLYSFYQYKAAVQELERQKKNEKGDQA